MSVLARRWVPRWAAVVTVIMLVLVVVGGVVAAVIPPMAREAAQFVTQAPTILARWQSHQSVLGRFTDRLHLQQRLEHTLSGDVSGLFSGLLGAGQVVLNAVSSTGIVAVLIVYFVADLPHIRATRYRLEVLWSGASFPRALLDMERPLTGSIRGRTVRLALDDEKKDRSGGDPSDSSDHGC